MAKKQLTLERALPFILAIAGMIGFLCAAIIMYDKVQILKNPHYVPSCNLDPIIACGSVMQSKQATAFGFPNPFLGLGGFAGLGIIGFGLLAGAKFKRWFWLGLQIGTVFGIGFCHWLFFESVYRIHALCPYCMVVWVVTITTFWYVTLYNIDHGNLNLFGLKQTKFYGWVRRHHLDLLFLWFLIIACLILKHFWYYYGHYL
jgi:uncharacterized membrane protein